MHEGVFLSQKCITGSGYYSRGIIPIIHYNSFSSTDDIPHIYSKFKFIVSEKYKFGLYWLDFQTFSTSTLFPLSYYRGLSTVKFN